MSILQLKQSPELLLELETYIKTGRIGFGLLTLDRKEEAVTNELVIEYREDRPILHIKNPDGKVIPVATASDRLVEEFMKKFLEVGKTMMFPEYQPKIFFMTKQDETFSQESLREFHQYIQTHHAEIKPQVTHVFKDGTEHKLVPYVGTNFVWYDLGQVIQNENIRSLDVVMSMLYRLSSDAREQLGNMSTNLKEKVETYYQKTIQDNDRQDQVLGKLQQDVAKVEAEVSGIASKLGIINGENEKRMRYKEFHVAGDPGKVYPVKLTYEGGELSLDNATGYEYFLGPMFVTFQTSTKNGILQLGSLHSHNSPRYYAGGEEETFIYSHHISGTGSQKHILYDAHLVAPGSYVIYCKGGVTYKVWSKYIDFVQIENTLQKIGSYEILTTESKPNTVLCNDQYMNKDVVLHFHKSIHVTESIIVNHQYQIKLGESS